MHITHRPGPDPEWLATWRLRHAEQRDEAESASAELLDRLGGHDAGWSLVDRLVSAKNAIDDLETEYALALMADHFPSLAFAMRAMAAHILSRHSATEWTCCSGIERA